MNGKKASDHIFKLIDDGILDSETFLKRLLHAMSEQEILKNLEFIQELENWDASVRFRNEG